MPHNPVSLPELTDLCSLHAQPTLTFFPYSVDTFFSFSCPLASPLLHPGPDLPQVGHFLTYRAPTVCHMNTESSFQPIEKKRELAWSLGKMISQSAEIHSEMVPGGRTQREDLKDFEDSKALSLQWGLGTGVFLIGLI